MTKRELLIKNRIYKRGILDNLTLIERNNKIKKLTEIILRIMRINKKLHKIAVDDANGNPLYTAQQGTIQDKKRAFENEKKWEKYIKEINIYSQKYDFKIEVQDDCRGSIIKLFLDKVLNDTDLIN